MEGNHVNVFAPPYSKNVPGKPIKISFGGILLGYPTLHPQYGAMVNGGPKLAVTMFESDKIPDDWVEPLNDCDAIVVPSQFLVKVFKSAGITPPIHVIPLGVSDEFMQYRSRFSRKTPFRFLTVGDRGSRKGWWEVIHAFVNTFGDNPDVRLTVKSRALPFKLNNPNIDIIAEDYTNKELAKLYYDSHVMVFASKGEGFGLPPREFAATGGLVLATNWGGLSDDINNWGYPIPAVMESAFDDDERYRNTTGNWGKPYGKSLESLMKDTHMHYNHFEALRVKASVFCRANYTWGLFANRVLNLWQDIANGSNNSRTEPVAQAKKTGTYTSAQ